MSDLVTLGAPTPLTLETDLHPLFSPAPVDEPAVARVNPDVWIGRDTQDHLTGEPETPGAMVRLGTSLLADPKNRPLYEGRF